MAPVDQLTRIGAPGHRRGLRLGIAAWVALVLVGGAAGAGARYLQDDDEAPPAVVRSAPLGDVDGDGRSDLLVSTEAEVRAYASRGARFEASAYATDAAEEAIRGDVDGDGRADLVTAVPSRESTDVVVRLAGEGRWKEPKRLRVDGVGRGGRMLLADVDGDGDDDLVAAGEAGVLVAAARKGVLQPAEHWADDLGLDAQEFLVAGRFTDDARADLLLVEGDQERVVLRLLTSTTGEGFGEPELWREVPDWDLARLRPSVGDFDGDGRTDLAELGSPLEGGTDVMVLRSRGVDFAPPRQWLLEPGLDWETTRLVSGDFDDDGFDDLATLRRRPDLTTDVVVHLSTGDGLRAPATWFSADWPGNPRPVGVGTGVLGQR